MYKSINIILDVPIYASGPMSYLFDGTVEESFIAHVMAYSAW